MRSSVSSILRSPAQSLHRPSRKPGLTATGCIGSSVALDVGVLCEPAPNANRALLFEWRQSGCAFGLQILTLFRDVPFMIDYPFHLISFADDQNRAAATPHQLFRD